MDRITLAVKGMSCQHCVKSIEGSVGNMEGVNKVKVNLKEANVAVVFDLAQVSPEQIKECIESRGYEVCR
ncbi:copper chaperone CopZ [Neobacillus sp. SAB-20_R2A]|uniref:copper chaperone CopZ n=1 Tax=Neobacillus sp. SAB-20_R2A TaxID=3120519 RepID=UPI003C6E3ED6